MGFRIPFLPSAPQPLLKLSAIGYLQQLHNQRLQQSQYSPHHAKPMDQWRFDVSSFMVLLGESQEINYRLMRRSLLECFVAAPVAGLQSYIHDNYALIQSVGKSYCSPYGLKSAPLRNMRLDLSISHEKVLRDGNFVVYRFRNDIETGQECKQSTRNIIFWLRLWVGTTWVISGAIIATVVICSPGGLTWVGLLNCVAFPLWSIFLRLCDWYCLGEADTKLHPDTFHEKDAVFILGRRNSCFVLEGRRDQVHKWTGMGLATEDTRTTQFLKAFCNLGSLVVILMIFTTLPNGSVWDQIGFIASNLLGQANVFLGQKLAAKECLAELELFEMEEASTRTHVYAKLLRRFENIGDEDWVGKSGLLPHGKSWDTWKERVIKENLADPKELWSECKRILRNKKQEAVQIPDKHTKV